MESPSEKPFSGFQRALMLDIFLRLIRLLFVFADT